MSHWESIKAQASAAVRRELGEGILYHYRDGNTQPLCAIFTMADVQVSMGGEVGIDSRKPMASVRRCDMHRKPRQGDLITRRQVTYEIQQVAEEHDATFNCLLLAVDTRHGHAVRSHT
jgi:hypothetical protein